MALPVEGGEAEMAEATEELIEVPERHRFNLDSLFSFLSDNLTGFKCRRGGLKVQQFK